MAIRVAGAQGATATAGHGRNDQPVATFGFLNRADAETAAKKMSEIVAAAAGGITPPR